MRLSIAIAALSSVVLIMGCSTPAPARPADSSNVQNFGPAGGALVPVAAAAAPFQWHTRLADAQADARRTGRLIMATSTRSGCTLCERFKDGVVPQTQASVAAIATGYLYDIGAPEVPQVDRTLRDNLVGAQKMPLVGFLTPELGFVHGFWGATDASRFQAVVQQTAQRYPSAGSRRRTATPPGARTAVVNEFGETEWSVPGDVWAPGSEIAPEDAITGRPVPSGTPALGPTTRPIATQPPGPGPVTPTTQPNPATQPLPPVGPTTQPLPPVGPTTQPLPTTTPPPAGSSNPPFSRPQQPPFTRRATGTPPVSRTQAPPTTTPLPGPAPATTTPPSQPVPPFATRPQPGEDREAWGRASLQRALEQIRAGDHASARSTLDAVKQQMPGTILAREAAKGGIAIYNHKKLRTLTGAARDRHLARAQKDLGATMWGSLFQN